MLARMGVTAAEPSGLWGTLMETLAGGSAFAASLVTIECPLWVMSRHQSADQGCPLYP